MRSRLFDRDPLTGTTKIWHYDETTDQATIETIRDVQDHADINKAVRNEYDERARWASGVGNQVASIPLNVWDDADTKMGGALMNDDKVLLKWLDDRDQGVFRTRPGRLSK